MKIVFERAMALLLGLMAATGYAAMEEGGPLAPEPTVSGIWVVVFLLVFVGICVWIGVAIWRNERKDRAKNQESARS